MRENQDKMIFDATQLKAVSPMPSLNLPDIEQKECLEPLDGSPYRVYMCEGGKPWRNRSCKKCGSINIRSLGYTPEPRLIHDVNTGIIQNDIILKVDRYQCNDCGESFSRQFDGIMENRQMTSRLYDQIRRDAFRLPFVDVAAQYGYSDTTIANIFDEYSAELEAKRGTIIAPFALGIDEKHIVHKMRAVFVDLDTGELIEMRPDNKMKDIISTIKSMDGYDDRIRIVTMDMANGYKSYVEDCLPDAKIIVDKYHVYQDLYKKVTRTKTLILETIGKQIAAVEDPERKQHLQDVRDLVLNNSYLFKFSLEKLVEKGHRIAAMADLCDTFPEFNHLRLLKEGFERIYDCEKRDDAERLYDEWTSLVPPTGANQIKAWETKYGVKAELFKEFRVFRNAMKKWRKEVFNYFDENCDYTNAAAEGMNSLIQRMNSLGNGYSFERLRARALFWHTASPRISYSVDKKSIAKQRFKNTGNNFTTWFQKVGYDSPQFETYYVDKIMFIGTEEDKNYEPTSVYKYSEISRKHNPEGLIEGPYPNTENAPHKTW